MANGSLSLPERSALLALMTFVQGASNTDLNERFNFKIEKGVRNRLKELGLIKAKQTRELRGAFFHELTDEGWRRCREELAEQPPNQAQKGYRLLYGVLHLLDNYLTSTKLEMADLFAKADEDPQPLEAEDIDKQIHSAYDSLAAEPGAWVSLTKLRSELPEVPRQELDAALLRIDLESQTYLIPEANQKVLSAADREAAIHIGGEDKHLLSIERS